MVEPDAILISVIECPERFGPQPTRLGPGSGVRSETSLRRTARNTYQGFASSRSGHENPIQYTLTGHQRGNAVARLMVGGLPAR